jgi:short subunit dehydrogenase-like uncharacterized protein
MMKILIYGAYGYLGQRISQAAKQRNLDLILAGRSESKIAPLAKRLNTEYRIFDLEGEINSEVIFQGVACVLNCAGPFSNTASILAQLCINSNVHYLDITGEIPVFQALNSLDQAAKDARVMLLPGIGFDVAPTDCLALYLKNKLPNAKKLELGFKINGPSRMPPGTVNTLIDLAPLGNLVRIEGQLVRPPFGAKYRDIDFGHGPERAMRINWGDVFTAYYSTGIPSIEDYVSLSLPLHVQMLALEYFRPLLHIRFVREIMKRILPSGSTQAQLEATSTQVWGRVEDGSGQSAAARLNGPDAGVVWTTEIVLAALKRIEKGEIVPGYQTPATAFGPDFVFDVAGVSREDVH